MQFIRQLLFFLLFSRSLHAHIYDFSDELIDVIIPCHAKDVDMLEHCLEGIKLYGQNLRRIIVISDQKLTDNAEYFSETDFPFSKDMVYSVALTGKNSSKQIEDKFSQRLSWIYQQLLKFYAPFIIPDISDNVLILDADAVLFKPITFMDPITNSALFSVGTENHKPYFDHARKLIPGFRRVYPSHSGICHHMLFQKPVLEHLFAQVQTLHNEPFWIAFCKQIDVNEFSGCSEYEIYFNFAQMHSNQFSIRQLQWKNVPYFDKEADSSDFHYVACHKWMREKRKKKGKK